MIDQIKERADSFGVAHENRDLELDVRQALFKTRRGRVCRVIFFVNDRDVYVLRVCGLGQASVGHEEIF